MGNSNGPQMLYNPSGGVVMDIESANIKSAQLNRKSERSISPMPSHNHIIIDDQTKKTFKKEKDPKRNYSIILFESNEYNPQSCYSIWLCIDGEWKNVILDDFFPVSKKDPNSGPSLLFSRSNGPELWVLLLEKAYAKINKCYQNIEAGLCEEALRDLTGAPTLTLSDFNEEEAWEFMKSANQKKFLLVVSSQFEKKEGKNGGLISGHCYSVLDIREVKSNEGKERLIQIRNPWGHKEWTGDWSDDSNKWTEDFRKDLKWEKKDDGIFWMNCKDFCAYYSEITVCQVHENFRRTKYF